MKRIGLGLLVLVTASVFACEVKVGGEAGTGGAASPSNPPAGTPAPTPVPTLKPPTNSSRLDRLRAMTRRTGPSTLPSASGTPTTPGTTPPPTPTTPGTVTPPTPPSTDPTFMGGTNAFGTGTPMDGGFKGSVYFLATPAQKFPAVDNLTPNAVLFAKELNIAGKEFTEGFPGVDPKRVDNFAIRYEAPLVVSKEATFAFRLVADDGAIFTIDDTVIVDNDGAHAATEKVGAAHLIPGTHYMRVDYLQAGSKTIALQMFVRPEGGQEKPLSPQL